MSKDFASAIELSAALLGFNPSIEKDIRSIEQGTVASIFMTHSPKSLKSLSDLTNIYETNIKLLESRFVFVSYEYLEFEESTKNFKKHLVLIRPTSLKNEDAQKAIQLCNEYSLISLIRFLNYFLNYKELNFIKNSSILMQQMKEHILYTDSIDKDIIIEMILRFFSYSLDVYLNQLNINQKLLNFLYNFSTKPSKEIYDYLVSNKEMDEESKQYLLEKGQYPLLMELSKKFLYYYPNFKKTIFFDEETEDFLLSKNELEFFLEIAKEILLRLIYYIQTDFEPKNTNPSWDDIFSLLNSHPSLLSEEWPNVKELIETVNTLIHICEEFDGIRFNILIEGLVQIFLKKLNMNFSFEILSFENFTIPNTFLENLDTNKQDIFFQFIKKLRSNPELIVYESKSQSKDKSYYCIYKTNIPQCFIRNKHHRNLIHLMLKNSGYINGIYDFLLDISQKNKKTSLPQMIIDEQIKLHHAIKEWEKQNQKKSKKSFFLLLWNWLQKLFGITSQEQEKEGYFLPQPETYQINKNKPIQKRKLQIPKEKMRLIPEKIEKAIEFIERQHKGLIWVEELAYALHYKDIEELYTILYYDKQQKYEEIKPLKNIKYLFIRKENLYNIQWLNQTIEMLQSSSKLPHQSVLLEYLLEIKKTLTE